MNDDVHLVSSEVVDLLDLYLAAFLCLQNGLDDHWSRLAERNLSNGKGVLVDLLDSCADLDLASLALAAVLRTVCRSSCEEVREYFEVLTLKDGYGGVYEFVEIVWKNLRGKSCSDTLGTLGKKNREAR